MTELYLDCEFNGNKGCLISIALYNPKTDFHFYEVDEFWIELSTFNSPIDHKYRAMNDWVRENVIPKLGKRGIPKDRIKSLLAQYLGNFEDETIIYADWPEDFVHLNELLYITPEGKTPNKLIDSLTMKLITTPDDHKSVIPHNALEDAKALHQNHKFTVITNLRPK